MSESKTSAWKEAASLCTRGIRYCLDYPARKAAARKALDEDILKHLPSDVSADRVTPEQWRYLRRDFRKIDREYQIELKKRLEESAHEALLETFALMDAQRPEGGETGMSPHEPAPSNCGL